MKQGSVRRVGWIVVVDRWGVDVEKTDSPDEYVRPSFPFEVSTS